MLQPTNKPTQFWQELKRRKVFRVIAMYAATAFILLEVVDIITPALLLPSWTVTLVIVLLTIGFPVAVILSWIFDFTPEGVIKTESAKVLKQKETPSMPQKRKPGVSDVIIAVLVVVVGILAYPKIFNKDKFENIRDADGRISVAVMPFENQTGDSLYNVWQGGLQNLLISTLSNSDELSVRQFQTTYSVMKGVQSTNYASITPAMASKVAAKLNTNTFILGNILKAGNNIRINAQLVNAETEEIYKTYQVEGKKEDDIFRMADSLTSFIKNYLEIEKILEQHDSPSLYGSFNTNSSKAFRYYIHGWEAFRDFNHQASIEWVLKAIEEDPGFIRPYIGLSLLYSISGNDELAKHWCIKAYEKRDILSLIDKLRLDYLNAYYFETPSEQIKYLKQFLEIEEMNTFYWFLLGIAYFQQESFEESTVYSEKVIEIHKNLGTVSRNLFNYELLGISYHKINEHKKEKEVFELGLSLFPEYGDIIQRQAICALSQGDTIEADLFLTKYRSIRKNKEYWSESRIITGVGDIYDDAGMPGKAEMYYRKSMALDPGIPTTLNNLARILINNEINIDEGLELVEKALELKPDNCYYLDTKGWGLYKQAKYEEAYKVLKDAWESRPMYVHVRYMHLQEVEQALASQNQ